MDVVEEHTQDSPTQDLIGRKILHCLSIYPQISPSMLVVGIGTAFPTAMWTPVLERLIMEGKVDKTQVQAETPSGRMNVYTILSLVRKVTA